MISANRLVLEMKTLRRVNDSTNHARRRHRLRRKKPREGPGSLNSSQLDHSPLLRSEKELIS
jgi:hypothetical protein